MKNPQVGRREALEALMGAAAALSMGGLLAACDKGDGQGPDGVPGDTDSGGADDGRWLSGGTALLGADYALSFDEDCSQFCELTLGPCYVESPERADISEGVQGLPTRMAFKVVDVDCNPVPGAVVDVWHCSPSGLYSGSEAPAMCTAGDSEARSGRWFRGAQTTDSDGVVEFDTCMPGWYPGRALHVHLQVRLDGDVTLTSQVGFPTALEEDVFANHPAYSGYGPPDTPNDQDSILRRDLDAFLLSWRRADDGALVVWKTLGIRRSLDEASC